LRIGLGVCLLADILLHYAPDTFLFFASGSLGDPSVFNWRFRSPRSEWSVLRGVSDPSNFYLSLGAWLVLTCWILGNAAARLLARINPPRDDRSGLAVPLWTCAFAWYTASVWSGMLADNSFGPLAWVLPMAGAGLCGLFFVLDLAQRLVDEQHPVAWRGSVFSALVCAGLLAFGLRLALIEQVDPQAWWVRLLKPWQEDRIMLGAAMSLWIAFSVLLLVGCCTRLAAIVSWVLSVSFASANPYLDNAGDTIRLILLFYLMLTPCAAAWSVDAWRRAGPRYVDVHPWAIRILLVQMMFIYVMNGLYKLFGDSWLEGNSLHYVLGDAILTRVSQRQFPLPIELTRMMTWSVLAWELSFPLLMLWKWTRRPALVFGVLFHFGIFASLELATFVPYALCMYLPLLPLERWRRQAQG
jgi:hypothetical protein